IVGRLERSGRLRDLEIGPMVPLRRIAANGVHISRESLHGGGPIGWRLLEVGGHSCAGPARLQSPLRKPPKGRIAPEGIAAASRKGRRGLGLLKSSKTARSPPALSREIIFRLR